jgi:hypothetical protein
MVIFAATPVHASLIVGFDDLRNGSSVPNGYNGFQWDQAGVFDASPYVGSPGYGQALVSPNNIAFSDELPFGFHTLGSDVFTFNGGFFSSGFNDGLTVEVHGLLGGTQLYTSTLTLNTTNQTFATFNYANIDQVEIIVIDPGTRASGLPYSGNGAQFGVDDLSFNDTDVRAAPTPSSAVLAIIGIGSLRACAKTP